jgi:hypothetical protein
MSLVVPNFARTTLRASVSPSQTQLALAIGGGSYFNIGTGNYMYITVEDGQSVEIMRYDCTGPVVNDIINVVRGEDGTTPKSFPAGACVKVAWNVAQLQDLMNQTFISIFNSTTLPPNTIQVQTVPTAPPPMNVYYAIWTQQKRFFYWDGTAWIEIGNARDAVLAGYGPPSGAPTGVVSFYVDLNSGAMYYWTGTAWLQVSGQAAISSEEYWVRSGKNLNFPIPLGGVGTPLGNVPAGDRYRRFPNNVAANSNLELQPHDGFNRVTLKTAPAAVSLTITVSGRFGTGSEVSPTNCSVSLVLTNSTSGESWGNSANVPVGFQPAVVIAVSTDVLTFAAGTYFDGNIVYSGPGGSAANFYIKQISYTYHVVESGAGINPVAAAAQAGIF